MAMTTWKERLLSLFGVAGFIVNEILGRKKAPSVEPPAPPNEDGWRDIVDIEAAMPTLGDFPMGWTVQDHGSTETFGKDPDYEFAYRVLELNAPTSAGLQWVAVWSGANRSEFTQGSWPTRTRDEAYDQLARRERTVSEI